MDKKWIVNRQGKDMVLYSGLLDQAHGEGLKRISTALVQSPTEENGQTAICWAEVETSKGSFAGIGDANPNNVGRMIIPHLIRMAECCRLDAQILTRLGWKFHDELTIGELVLAYDVATDASRWVSLQAVTVYRDPRPTLRLSGRSFEVTCTPEHTWASAPQHARRRMVKTNELQTNDKIVIAARAAGGDCPLLPREAALLGWLATDGWVRSNKYHRVGITQSKPAYVAELAALVGTDGSRRIAPGRKRDFRSYVSNCLPQNTFELTAQFGRELLEKAGWTAWSDLPAIVTSLSQEARAAMLDAMLKGDGSRKRRSDAWTFGKKAKPGVMEAFEILATLEGRALGKPGVSSVGDVPTRMVRANRHITASYLIVEDGGMHPVWCPTTELGTWVVRTGEGTITITGNTRAKARALRDAINVGTVALEELGDLDGPEDAPVRGRRGIDPARREQMQRTRPYVAGTVDRDTTTPPATPGSATEVQVARIKDLAARLGVEALPDPDLSAELASARIAELARAINEQSKAQVLAQRAAVAAATSPAPPAPTPQPTDNVRPLRTAAQPSVAAANLAIALAIEVTSKLYAIGSTAITMPDDEMPYPELVALLDERLAMAVRWLDEGTAERKGRPQAGGPIDKMFDAYTGVGLALAPPPALTKTSAEYLLKLLGGVWAGQHSASSAAGL